MDKEKYYFEKSPVSKAIAYMCIPMMLGMCVNIILNIIDTFFLGMLHNTEMITAVTLTLPFTALIMAIGSVFAVGGGTLISRLIGNNDYKKAKNTSFLSIIYSLIFGAIIGILGLIFINPILNILGANIDTFAFTKEYLSVYLIGSPIYVLFFALENIVRSEGASKQSMIGMIISVVFNIILDPILIFGFNMGVLGASIASAIGSFCAVLYYVYYLYKKSPFLNKFTHEKKLDISITKEIFSVGISAFLFDLFLVVTSLLYNNLIVEYGNYSVAAFGIGMKIDQLIDFGMMGLSMGVIPLIAYSYAQKNFTRLKEIIKKTSFYMFIFAVPIGLIIFLFRYQAIGLFSIDTAVIKLGAYILGFSILANIFSGFSGLFTGVLQAFGKGKEASIISIIKGVLYIIFIILGNIIFGLHGIIWATLGTEIILFIICLIMLITIKRKEKL